MTFPRSLTSCSRCVISPSAFPGTSRYWARHPVLDEDTDPDFHHTVYIIGGGMLLGLHQHKSPAQAEPFSEYRVGLDHVAFGCESRDDLEKWARRLDELGVEHDGIKDAHYGSGLSFRDPDGVALEFFAPPR